MEQINFPSYDLTGKRALVTGAGSGIGQAAAVILAHYGAKVAVCDISPERAEETVSAIRAAGGEAIPACGDVSNADSVAQIFGAVDEAFGGLDVLISNAGIGGDVLPILEQSEQAVRQPEGGVPLRPSGGGADDPAGEGRTDHLYLVHCRL